MTVRERILSIRLSEKVQHQKEYSKHIGVVIKERIERIVDQNNRKKEGSVEKTVHCIEEVKIHSAT